MASHAQRPGRRRLSDPGAVLSAPSTSGLFEAAATAAAASVLTAKQHEAGGLRAHESTLPVIVAAIAAAAARKAGDKGTWALGPASHRLRWGVHAEDGGEVAGTEAAAPLEKRSSSKSKRSRSPTGERAGPASQPPPPSAAAATRPMSAARLIQLQRSTAPIAIGKATPPAAGQQNSSSAHHQQVLVAPTPSRGGSSKQLSSPPPPQGGAGSSTAATSPQRTAKDNSGTSRRKGSSTGSPRRSSPVRAHPAVPAPAPGRSSALEAAIRDSYFPCVKRAARLWAVDEAAMPSVRLGALRDAVTPATSAGEGVAPDADGGGGASPSAGGGGAGARGWVESRVSALSSRDLRTVAEGPELALPPDVESGGNDDGSGGQPLRHRFAASDAPRAGADLVLVRRLRTRELMTGRVLPVTGGEGLVGGSGVTNPLLPSSGQGFKGVWAVAPFPAPAGGKKGSASNTEQQGTTGSATPATGATVSGLPSLFAMRLTPTLLLRRDMLRFHPRVVATSHRAWALAQRYSCRARSAVLDQDTYVAFFSRVVAARRDVVARGGRGSAGGGATAAASNPTAADIAAVKAAWSVDSCGLPGLSFPLFQVAWFLAADTCPGLEPEVQAYAAILEGVLGVLDPKGTTKGLGRGAGAHPRTQAAAAAPRPRAGSAPPALGGATRRHRRAAAGHGASTLSILLRDASLPLSEGAARYLRALPRYWGYVTACAGAAGAAASKGKGAAAAAAGGAKGLTAPQVRAALCRPELRPSVGKSGPVPHHMAVPDERRAEEVEALAPGLFKGATAPPLGLGVVTYKEGVAAAAAAAAVAKIGSRGIGRPTSAAAVAAAAAAAAAAVLPQQPPPGGGTVPPDSVKKPLPVPLPVALAPVIAPLPVNAPLAIPAVITKSVDSPTSSGPRGSGIIMAAPVMFRELGGSGSPLSVPVLEVGGGQHNRMASLDVEALLVEGEEPGMWGDMEVSYALPTASTRPSVMLTPVPSLLLVGSGGGVGSTVSNSLHPSLVMSTDAGEASVAAAAAPGTTAPSPVLTFETETAPALVASRSPSPGVPPASPKASGSPGSLKAASSSPATPAPAAGGSSASSPASPPSPPSLHSRTPSPTAAQTKTSRSPSPVPFVSALGAEETVAATPRAPSPPPQTNVNRTRSSSAVIDLNLQFAPPQQVMFTAGAGAGEGSSSNSPPPPSPPSPPPAAAPALPVELPPPFTAPVLLTGGDSLEELPLHHQAKGSPTSIASPVMLAPSAYESPLPRVAEGAPLFNHMAKPLPVVPEHKPLPTATASASGAHGAARGELVLTAPPAFAAAVDGVADGIYTDGTGEQADKHGAYAYEGDAAGGQYYGDAGEGPHYYTGGWDGGVEQGEEWPAGAYLPPTLHNTSGLPDAQQVSTQPSLAGGAAAYGSRPGSRGKGAVAPPVVQHIGPMQRRINDPVPSLAAQMMVSLARETQKMERRSVGGGGGGGAGGTAAGKGGIRAVAGGVSDRLPGPAPVSGADGSGSEHAARSSSPPVTSGGSELANNFAGVEGSGSVEGSLLSASKVPDSPQSPLMPAGAGFSALSLGQLDDDGSGAGFNDLLPSFPAPAEGGTTQPGASTEEEHQLLAAVSRVARAASAEYQRLGDGVPEWKRTGLLPSGKVAPSPVLRKSRPVSAGGAMGAFASGAGGGLDGGGAASARRRPLSALPSRRGGHGGDDDDESSAAGGSGTARDSILFGSLMQSSDGGGELPPLQALDGGPSVGMLLFSGGAATGSDEAGEGSPGTTSGGGRGGKAAPSASFDVTDSLGDDFVEDLGDGDSPTFSPRPPPSPLLVAIPGIALGGGRGEGEAALYGSPIRLSSVPVAAAGASGSSSSGAVPSYTVHDAWVVHSAAPPSAFLGAGEQTTGQGHYHQLQAQQQQAAYQQLHPVSYQSVQPPSASLAATVASGSDSDAWVVAAAPGAAWAPSSPLAAATTPRVGTAAGARPFSRGPSPSSPALDIGLDDGELDLLAAPPAVRRSGGASLFGAPSSLPRAAWAGNLAAAANALFPQGPELLKPLARDMLQAKQQQQRPGSRQGGGGEAPATPRLGDAPAPPSPVLPSTAASQFRPDDEATHASASVFTRSTRLFTLDSQMPPETEASMLGNASLGHGQSAVLAALPSLDAPLPPPPSATSGRPGSAVRLRTLSSASASQSAGGRPTSAGRRPVSASRGSSRGGSAAGPSSSSGRPTTPRIGRLLLSIEEAAPLPADSAPARPNSRGGRPRSAGRAVGAASDVVMPTGVARFPASVPPRPGSPPGTLRSSPRPTSAGRGSRGSWGPASAGRAPHDRIDAFLAQQQQEALQVNTVQSSNQRRPGTAGTVPSPRPTTPGGKPAASAITASRGYRATVETTPSLASTYVRWAKALKPDALPGVKPPDPGLTLSKSPLRGGRGPAVGAGTGATAALGASAQPGFTLGASAGRGGPGGDGDDWVLTGGSGSGVGIEVQPRPTTPSRRGGSASPNKAMRGGGTGGGRLATGGNAFNARSGGPALQPGGRRAPGGLQVGEGGMPPLSSGGVAVTPARTGAGVTAGRLSSAAPRSPSPTRQTPRGRGSLVPPPSPLAAAGARALLRPGSAVGTPTVGSSNTSNTGGLLLGRSTAAGTPAVPGGKPSTGGVSGFSGASGGLTPRASQGSLAVTPRTPFP